MAEDLSRREALKAIGTSLPAVSLAPGRGQRPTASRAETGRPDWRGKALVIYTRSQGPSMPLILTECRFEPLGGRLFLAGVDRSCSRSLTEWSEGARRSVAWEAVESYLIFDSLDDYYDRLDNDSRDDEETANGPSPLDEGVGRVGDVSEIAHEH
jgi:hypothetical protein